ncbi:Leucyl/phenylalanyl-tRNA--protein transferase [Marinomonas aquimarina]|uniref:Leucyl/phenylalanyl-tRNA--protein transferase n=1 Tax=Marinomonas aquimarina TaxID=295068 RepID=A0A1A8T4B3_9GAMM|nr:leucyl/phenylalanyl-tRNA--protein transferase [Marinomonas aquimarina]SBS26782.1 Leucyl/phenylalanyl-tRNA--protein transferase [Marinomonas aquimarina]
MTEPIMPDHTVNEPEFTPEFTPELVLLTESIFDTPDPFKALLDPEGLSAIGGDLRPERLIHLYQHGFFPWYSDPDPILWWHPLERCTLAPADFHESRSLRKALKRGEWSWKVNANFLQAINICRDLRADAEGTWISKDVINAYSALNKQGYAFSLEVFYNGELAGGFYGVAMGRMFFGESMFSLKDNGSKVALWQFCKLASHLGIELIDCQVYSEHLTSLGAQMMTKASFVKALQELIPSPTQNHELIALSGQETANPITYIAV